jgi:hypothetical protein
VTTIFGDTGFPGYLDPARPNEVTRIALQGIEHEGAGELERLQHLEGDRYAAVFNIDGVSWVYETLLDEAERTLSVERLLVGKGELSGGVLHGLHFDEESERYALSFCTATMPTQLYVLEPDRSAPPSRKTHERALGLRPELLSPGEDASFESHDGLRVCTCRRRPSATTARGRSSTTCTGGRRARSGRTSRGSRCPSSRSSPSRDSPCSSPTCVGLGATDSRTRSGSTATGAETTASTTSTR